MSFHNQGRTKKTKDNPIPTINNSGSLLNFPPNRSRLVKQMIYSVSSYLKAAAYGTALWYMASLFCKHSRRRIFEKESPRRNLFRVYVALIPISYVGLYGLILLGIDGKDLVEHVVIATATATLLDAIALEWIPSLYGCESSFIVGARPAAAIFWGVGCGLFASVHMQMMYER